MKFMMMFFLLSLLTMMISFILSKKTFSEKEKSSPFECGFDPYLASRTPFSLRFFKIAIIFMIFDVEIILMLPLPLIMQSMSAHFIYSSSFTIIIIFMGLLFEWNQGSLEWMK